MDNDSSFLSVLREKFQSVITIIMVYHVLGGFERIILSNLFQVLSRYELSK